MVDTDARSVASQKRGCQKKGCQTILSKYNKDPYCYVHGRSSHTRQATRGRPHKKRLGLKSPNLLLFSRHSIEVLFFLVYLRGVDSFVLMLGRSVQRVELEWHTAHIDDIVMNTRRYDDRKVSTHLV